jgi:membrane protease YdiL (CAAX protease family)
MVPYVEARRRLARVRPEAWTALGCGVVLLVYGNVNSVVEHGTRERFLLWSNLAVMALLLLWALAAARMSLDELGLSPGRAPRSALVGLVLSVIVALPPVLFVLLAPVVNDGPVEAPEITERSGLGMAYFLAFRQPVGTALFEEVAFRGVLYATWRRAGGDRLAVVVSSGFFAAWHTVITSRTVADSGVVDQPALVALGVAVSLAFLFVGGLMFAYLRYRTGSIAAAVVAHWLIVAAMSLAVWVMA